MLNWRQKWKHVVSCCSLWSDSEKTQTERNDVNKKYLYRAFIN